MVDNLDPSNNNTDNFKTGAKVICKDPVFYDEEISGFVAKQVDDRIFLVKLDRSFRRKSSNDGKVWLKVSRDFAHQVCREI